LGADLVITLSGLRPGERGELTVRWSTRAPVGPITADATGEVHLRILVGDDAPIEVVARRASGEELRAAVGPPQAAPSADPADAAVPPSAVAPSGAPPSQTPTSRAGPRFAVTIDPADPPPGAAPDIVVGGLLAGEEFQLELTVGGAVDTHRVQADPTGSFRWRSPVPAGTSFQVAAVRLTGERASTGLHAAAAPTASPAATEPACVTTGSADARTGTAGDYVLAGRPMAGLNVEIREWTGDITAGERCTKCLLFGTGITDAQGHFAVMGLPPGILVEAVVPDARYTIVNPSAGGYSHGTQVCAGKIMSPTPLFGPRVIYWNVTGFEIGVRGISGRPTDGIETLHWDPVPGATSYCLQMFDKGPPPYQFRTSITTGSCMDLADHAALTTPTFRTPPLVAGDRGYDVRIVAFTGTYVSGVFAASFRKSE